MEVHESTPTSHRGERVCSYTINFKLEVIEYAELHTAALKYHVDHHCVRDWKKKKIELKDLFVSVDSKKRKRLQWQKTLQ